MQLTLQDMLDTSSQSAHIKRLCVNTLSYRTCSIAVIVVARAASKAPATTQQGPARLCLAEEL